MTESDPIDAALASVEDVPDDGFTDRVMRSLPDRRSADRRRAVILGCSSVAAGVAGFIVFPGGRVLGDALSAAASLSGTNPQMSTFFTLVVFALTAWAATVLVRLVADGP